MICAVILAAGRSRRFGREKAFADLGGRPMIAHVAAALVSGCERLAINAGPGTHAADYAEANGLPRLDDLADDPDGPLAGVRAAMTWARSIGANLVATAPCDAPFLPHDMVHKLAAALGACGAAVAATEDGLQPLCALWRADRLEVTIQALTHGHPAVRDILSEVGAAQVPFDDPRRFANVNTLEDHEVAMASLDLLG